MGRFPLPVTPLPRWNCSTSAPNAATSRLLFQLRSQRMRRSLRALSGEPGYSPPVAITCWTAAGTAPSDLTTLEQTFPEMGALFVLGSRTASREASNECLRPAHCLRSHLAGRGGPCVLADPGRTSGANCLHFSTHTLC